MKDARDGLYLWLLAALPVAGAVVGAATDRSGLVLVTVAIWVVGALVVAALTILVAEVVLERRLR